MPDVTRVSLCMAGLAGSLFLAYAVYFDRKRRSHPDFKKRLRERRELARKDQAAIYKIIDIPDIRDHQAMQNYFLEQIQLGEELLAERRIDEGLEHFGRAINLCGQPQKILELLQTNMPAPVFSMLLQRLPEINQRIMQHQALLLQNEDLE